MENNAVQTLDNNIQEVSAGKANMMLVLLALCGFAQGFVLFKLLPIQGLVMETFHIAESQYGILNGAQNFLALILMIPVGYMFRKQKAKVSLTFCAILFVIGGIIMTLATSFPMFVVGRAFEGAGVNLFTVLQFSLTLNLAKPERKSMIMGTMVSMVMIGQVVYMAISTPILATGLTLKELNTGILCVIVVCFAITCIACPIDLKIYGREAATKATKEQTRRIFRDKNVWFVTLAYCIFYLAIVAFASYQVQYLVMSKGMEIQSAANVITISSTLGIFAMIIWGAISDKFQTKRKVAIIGMFSTAICMVLFVVTPAAAIMIYTVWLGTMPRSIIGMTNNSSADLADTPSDVPIVNSFRDMVNMITLIVGNIIIGIALEAIGYSQTIMVLGVLAAIGGVLWIFAKRVK